MVEEVVEDDAEFTVDDPPGGGSMADSLSV